MKKKIYIRPVLEILILEQESQLMTGSAGISFGGSADDSDLADDNGNIWAE